jgi:hypothetical protein
MPRRNLVPYVLLLVLTLLAIGAAVLAVAQGPATVSPTTPTHQSAFGPCSTLRRDGGCQYFSVTVNPSTRACVFNEVRREITVTTDLSTLKKEMKAVIAKCDPSLIH